MLFTVLFLSKINRTAFVSGSRRPLRKFLCRYFGILAGLYVYAGKLISFLWFSALFRLSNNQLCFSFFCFGLFFICKVVNRCILTLFFFVFHFSYTCQWKCWGKLKLKPLRQLKAPAAFKNRK